MTVKPGWFLIGMVLVTVLACAFPGPGASGGWMHPEFTTKAGVALIFFLHGLMFSVAALQVGALSWRLHALVQGSTFLLPTMIYHPLQLMVCGGLAQRWGKQE